jgi:hypothetical protein
MRARRQVAFPGRRISPEPYLFALHSRGSGSGFDASALGTAPAAGGIFTAARRVDGERSAASPERMHPLRRGALYRVVLDRSSPRRVASPTGPTAGELAVAVAHATIASLLGIAGLMPDKPLTAGPSSDSARSSCDATAAPVANSPILVTSHGLPSCGARCALTNFPIPP